MSTAALILTREFAPITCGKCGIEYWVPKDWDFRRRVYREERGEHYCPNGHCRVWTGETDLEKAQRDLRQANEKLEWEQKRTAKLERDAKKLKKRIAAGVCPCCHRTFTNLARHMSGEHPDYNASKAAAAK